ncbi:DUF6499 domain-containing protein [Mesorhizobium sp.]|uniref:transcriptional regulator domain-containing protein n=2 Tax=Mesorhizobium sp. TaxID=1871066 RepID=UPI00344E910D
MSQPMLIPKPAAECWHRRGLGTLQGDWTNPAVYMHMRDYEASEFAAEYLIRNDDFIVECSELASLGANTGDLLGPPDFAARWGARFHSHR